MIIDQLPLLSGDAQTTDEIPIERGTTTYKVTLDRLLAALPKDAVPTEDSTNVVESGGVYDALETVANGAAESIATYVRPNLLENWYFVGGGSQQGYGVFPINQRGQASYSNSGFCIDRWQTSGSSIKCQLTANGIVLNQNLFQNAVLFSQLSGKTITASVLTSTELVILTVTLPTDEPTARVRFGGAGNTVEVYLDYDPTSKTVQVVIYSSVDSTIKAVKLELGSTQTLAHQMGGVWVLNEVPNYAEQLAKCQAYLLPLTPWLHFTGVIRTTTNVGVTIPTPVTMAKTPVFIGTISGGAIYKTDGQCTITGNGTPEIASLAANAVRANVPISVVSGTLPSIMYSLVNAAFDYSGNAFLSAE